MDTTIKPAFRERIYETLSTHVGLPLLTDQMGLIVTSDEKRATDSYQAVWLVDDKAIIRANPVHAERIRALISEADLSAENMMPALAKDGHEVVQVMLYALDADSFQPFTLDSRYTVRQLTQADTEAFATFEATCSQDDRDKGEVGLDQELAYGVLDGEHIVAVASTFEFWGMVDVGVLTEPAYRRQGLGKAIVSAVCEHYLQRKDDDRIVLYRHDTTNYGSSSIARGLNFQRFASIVYVKFAS